MISFLITETLDEVSVKSQPSRPLIRTVSFVALAAFVLFQLSQLILTAWPSHPSAVLFDTARHNVLRWVVDWTIQGTAVAIVGLVIFRLARAFFPSGQSLVCSRNEFVVGSIHAKSFTGKWTYESYPTALVRELRLTTVSYSEYRATLGLSFQVHGKPHSCLHGITVQEAARALESLRRLGLDTKVDVAMPMMVEMEKSRQRFLGGIFN